MKIFKYYKKFRFYMKKFFSEFLKNTKKVVNPFVLEQFLQELAVNRTDFIISKRIINQKGAFLSKMHLKIAIALSMHPYFGIAFEFIIS